MHFSSNVRLGTSPVLPLYSKLKFHPSVTNKIKRSLDIIGALIGLLIVAVIAVPIAIAMQLDNRGPIFFSQVRCGVNGKPFRIWKFRSMTVGAEKQKHLVINQAKGLIFKNECDPRITRIGRFLRKTSLDEFPQFWNVLRGEMSLVGTRPPTIDEVALYEEHHYKRLLVKPGITGEWQVKGRSNVLDFEEIVRMDLDYQRKWSNFYDLYLILCTVQVVLTRKGAC
ncbi:sugar transferase [Myxosarcina sp. GI1]|uniref:sugar transferase n=1 Tax=Myxosarcina sp. GI1 TaxID=1541065 RepID=UPI00056CEB32|nr:sugar transferase [Myxosarcina sp. GI1]